jgi:hypothetical protein
MGGDIVDIVRTWYGQWDDMEKIWIEHGVDRKGNGVDIGRTHGVVGQETE